MLDDKPSKTERQDEQRKSEFKLFIVIEDTIEGIIDFILRFMVTACHTLFYFVSEAPR